MKWKILGPTATVFGVALTLSSCALPKGSTDDDPGSDTLSVKEKFENYDLNDNGKISPAEYNEVATHITVVAFDANEDGAVTLAEWQTLEGAKSDAKFGKVDRNKDGKVTMEEALAHSKVHKPFAKRFAAVDTNRDGSVDLAECEAFAAKVRSTMR